MRLSRPLSLGLLLIACLPAAASATATRVRSLGGDGDFFEDTGNVLRWYGCLPSYGNTAILELGEFDPAHGATAADQQAVRQGAGAHVDLGPQGRDGTVAAYLFRPGESGDRPGAHILMYGRKWGGTQATILLGHDQSVDHVTPIVSETRRIGEVSLRLGIGVRCDLGARCYADLAGDWLGSNVVYERWDSRSFDRTLWGSYGWRARLFWSPGRTWAVVPAVAYARDHRWEIGAQAGDPPDRLDAWNWRAGLGLNLFPTGDVLGLASLEVRNWRTSTTTLAGDVASDGTFARLEDSSRLVARLGLEARLRPWLTLRGGVLSVGEGFRGARPPRGIGLADDFDLTLGLGLHLGDFDADFLLNDDALFNAGSIVTNAGSGERSTFSSVSLAYQF